MEVPSSNSKHCRHQEPTYGSYFKAHVFVPKTAERFGRIKGQCAAHLGDSNWASF